MKKFYKFTKSSAEDRRQELLEFIEKYNKKYRSYSAVMIWAKRINSFSLKEYEGFEFADEETSEEEWGWGHGGLAKYFPKHHIVVNDNIDLGKL